MLANLFAKLVRHLRRNRHSRRLRRPYVPALILAGC
jgi:hypothetical protein